MPLSVTCILHIDLILKDSPRYFSFKIYHQVILLVNRFISLKTFEAEDAM